MDGKWTTGGMIGKGLVLVAAIFICPGILFGGDWAPASSPGETASYRMEDLYHRLDAGAAGTPSAQTEPSASPDPGAAGYNINEIMEIAPAMDDANGAAASDVAAGKTFWGLTSGQWGLQTGTGNCNETKVPKTGQTSSYWPGDDGDLQKGAAWPVPRFTKNGDGTVTDNLTNLVWLEDASCSGPKSWRDALDFANGLCDIVGDGSDGDCGLSDGSVAGDWRLANGKELQSLVTWDYSYPALPDTEGAGQWTQGNPFLGDLAGREYWSSSSPVHDLDYVIYLDFGYGTTGKTLRESLMYGWPVRDRR